MVHVFLPSGQRLRLRLFPRPKASPSKKRTPKGEPLPALFAPPNEDETVVAANETQAARIVNFACVNPINVAILERFPRMGLKDWWLTSGCLVQTVWNMRCGRPATEGIHDYDIVYYSEDVSEEAEDQVIRDATKLFADLPVPIEVRNQARVHLWYPEKFGIAYSPLASASEGILRFPSTTTAVGLRRTGDDYLDVYAPFGLGNVWDMVVKPNRALPLADVYREKAGRWQAQWPKLIVRPWVVDSD
jgi:hypothetical protein